MNELTKYSLLNTQSCFVNDTKLRRSKFYRIKALTNVTFTVLQKIKSTNTELEDSTLDMSGVSLKEGDDIICNFSKIQLAGGSALLYEVTYRRI